MAMKQQVIAVTGGLDLVTDKLSVNPGTAQACLNYEVGVNRGIRSVDGFIRWDGREVLPAATQGIYFRSEAVEVGAFEPTQVFTVGTRYTLTTLAGDEYSGLCMFTQFTGSTGAGWKHIAIFAFLTPAMQDLTKIVQAASLAVDAGFATYVVEIDAFEDYASREAEYRDLISQLPGDSLTRIPGLHFFNDKLYAVTDLVAIEVSGATVLPLEGAPIYAAGVAEAIGTLALIRSAGDAGAPVVLELFDYSQDADVAASSALYSPTLAWNLVANGTFYTAASAADWGTVGTGWALSSGASGKATATAATSALVHALAAVAGYYYEIEYTITATGGTVTVSFGGLSDAQTVSGTYTKVGLASSTAALTFTGAAFSGTVDTVSVRVLSPELLGNGDFSAAGSWTPQNGTWVVTSGASGNATATDSTAYVQETVFAPVVGRTYRVKYDATVTLGAVRAILGTVDGATRTASGTYVDFITATGVNSLFFQGMSSEGSAFTGTIDNVSVTLVESVGTLVDHVSPERAALYCAEWDGPGGWARVDLGRQVEYTEGPATDDAAFFLTYQRRGYVSQLDNEAENRDDTGWIGADSWTTASSGQGSWVATSGDGGLTLDDSVEVTSLPFSGTVTQARTAVLTAQFSADVINVPAGCVVRGIEVRVKRRADPSDYGYDDLVTVGCTSSSSRANKASGAAIPSVAAGGLGREATYGGSEDLWLGGAGTSNLKPSDINDGGLNVQLAYRVTGASAFVAVDQVEIKVYYQEQTRKAFVNNTGGTPWDQEIEVIHYTVAEGVADAGVETRRGLLVLNPIVGTAADRPWLFGPGMGVYTEADQGGALLAYTNSVDEPITLASSYSVAEQDARYVFRSANPYASDQYDVIFIANGAEQAHMFDGQYALPIQTGLLAQFERPRHVAWAGNYLALGYATGSLSISDLGEPLTYLDAASLATEIGAGSAITGLLKLKGDSLGVWTRDTIFAIQGTDPASGLTRVEISPSSGAIEYSVLDAGEPIFLDYRGPATLSTTDTYGDFNRGRLAGVASPWFLERLQLPTRNQTADKTFVGGYVMRNKNQCRFLFADGWQATLTLTETDGVQTTTQRFYGDAGARDASAIKVLAVCSGTSSTWQDLAFMSFDLDPESSRYRYAFQLDAGRSFDGEEIIAQWMGQPLQMGAPFYRKHLDQLGLHGRAYGYAKMKVFKAFDYTTPVSDETTSASDTGTFYEFGVSGDVSSTEAPFKAMHTLRGSGEDVTILIESISAEASPHTIQNLVIRFEPEDPKA